MKKRFFLSLLFSTTIYLCRAGTADTINIYSNSMHKNIKCVVIKPDSYKYKNHFYPVVYLLHGYSGDFSNWIKKVPELKKEVDEFQLIIVCPDGHYSSWYFDSPLDSTMRYETYIAREVPDYIDKHYHTIKKRTARAITGLSMGGHGGLFLGFRHADFFGACGSMSGVVDLKATTQPYDLSKRIGDSINYAANWINYSVINVIVNYPKDSLAIIFDCGNSDPFANCNRQLHQKMLALKIPHDYIERPGKHEWSYWANSVKFQLLFFRNYFDRMKLK